MPIVEWLFFEPGHLKVHTSSDYVLMTMRQWQNNMLRKRLEYTAKNTNGFSQFAVFNGVN